MKLGLCTIATGSLSVEDALAVAADAGYRGVELWGRDHVGDRSARTCDEIRAAADRRGLEIPVYGSYLRVGTADYEESVDEELEVASRLGASLIRVWAGTEEYQDRTEDRWDRVVAELIDLSERAAEYGLGVTVEKHEGTVTNTGEGARRLIEAVDREHCGLNWQPLFGLSASDVLAEARALAPISNNVHVQAVPECGASPERRCLLEDAYVDLPAVLRAFDDAGFDGYVEVEFVTDDLALEIAGRRDREYLASILE